MLGSIYFYVLLIVVLIVLVGIAIANAVYFADIYNDGSENLTSTQAQQLTILNIVIVVLLTVSCGFVIYMIGQKSEIHTEHEDLKKTTMIKREEFDNKLNDVGEINKEILMKEQTRKEIENLVVDIKESSKKEKKSVIKTKDKLLAAKVDEVNELQEKIENMQGQIDEITSVHSDIVNVKDDVISSLNSKIEEHKSLLDEKDKDLKLKNDIILARKSNTSVLSEGIFSSKIDDEDELETTSDELFSDNTIEKVPIEDDNNTNEGSLDYSKEYQSYTRNNPIKLSDDKKPIDLSNDKNPIKLSDDKKSPYVSYLSRLSRGKNLTE